jgi:hypothetical protein
MKKLPAFLVYGASLLLIWQLWVFALISEWIINDSYALVNFPKAHPRLGIFVESGWNIAISGGRWFFLAASGVLLVLFLLSLSQNKPDERQPKAP